MGDIVYTEQKMETIRKIFKCYFKSIYRILFFIIMYNMGSWAMDASLTIYF